MKLLDVNHPFFLPRWRRVAVVAFCAAWAVLEILWMSPFWAVIAGALAIYTWYALIHSFDPAAVEKRDPPPRQ